MIVSSTVHSGADQRKHQSPTSLAFVPVTGEFPAQMASHSENVSIWLLVGFRLVRQTAVLSAVSYGMVLYYTMFKFKFKSFLLLYETSKNIQKQIALYNILGCAILHNLQQQNNRQFI